MNDEHIIGRIITISHNNIIAEIFSALGSYINVYDGVRFIGEIGSYVAIDDINRRIIAEIIAVDEKNELSFERLNKVSSSRYLRISLIGEISNGVFVFGVTKMPPIFSEIKLIGENDLQTILDTRDDHQVCADGNTKLTSLTIGTSVIFSDYNVKVKLNDFFGFHFAIFGNTGAGKSNTVAKMIQSIFLKTKYSACGAKFVVFDSNGEYKNAFREIPTKNKEIKVKFLTTSEYDPDEKIVIPVWALSVDDWAVLLHASEKTQVPVLRRALELIRIFDSDDSKRGAKELKKHILATVVKDILSGTDSPAAKHDKISSVLQKFHEGEFDLTTKITLHSDLDSKVKDSQATIAQAIEIDYGQMKAPASVIAFCDTVILPSIKEVAKTRKIIPYSLKRFLEAVNFAIIYEGSTNSNRIYEYSATLVARLQNLMESDAGDFFAQTEYSTVEDYIDSILGDNQILNIDISSLDDSATEVITKVVSKLLFDYLKRLDPRNSKPINLILEEAHRFVRTDMDYGVLGYNIFERIAKEGRKFGLLLGISSQRPSELSKTVVSQCNNFIIHRIQNPDDISYISRMVPYISQGTIERITYLRRGYALIFGTAINLPTVASIGKAEPTPNSANSNIVEKWYMQAHNGTND